METADLSRWVEERTALLAPPPDYRPDPGPALTRLHARIDSTPRRIARSSMAWAAAAAFGCAALLLLPGARALAQQLWQRFRLNRVEIVQVDVSAALQEGSSLLVKPLAPAPMPRPARDVEEARLRVGYPPRLPGRNVLPGTPKISTVDTMVFGTSLKRADFERALARAGATDQPVDPAWDNAFLGVEIGPSVIAEWPDITLSQTKPIVTSIPAGIDVHALEVALGRAFGLSKHEAEELARRTDAAQSFILNIGVGGRVILREVQLRSGPGTLRIDLDDRNKPHGITLIWGVSDRLYFLTASIDESLAIAIANSVE
jgi:hypothetical protein